MGSRHRPGTAPGPADDRTSTLCAPAGDPTPITQVKVRTRAKSITGFSLSKPVPGFKIGYQFTGSRLTSLDWMPFLLPNQQRQSTEGHSLGYKNSCTFPGPRRQPAMFKHRDKQQFLLTIYIVSQQHPYWSICSSLSHVVKE